MWATSGPSTAALSRSAGAARASSAAKPGNSFMSAMSPRPKAFSSAAHAAATPVAPIVADAPFRPCNAAFAVAESRLSVAALSSINCDAADSRYSSTMLRKKARIAARGSQLLQAPELSGVDDVEDIAGSFGITAGLVRLPSVHAPSSASARLPSAEP